MHEHFIGSSFNAHNAMDDVDALKSIMEQCKITITELGRFSFTLSCAIEFLSYQQECKKRLATLHPLMQAGISKGMAMKIAKSGLEMQHLQATSFRSDNILEDMRTLLSERFNRVIRVTNNKTVVKKIANWLEMNPIKKV